MKSLRYAITAGMIGLTSFGCEVDDGTDKELFRGKIGNVELRVIKNTRSYAGDPHTIEVYNEEGNLSAQFRAYPLLDGFIQYEDRKVNLRDNNFFEVEKKESKP